MGRPFRVCGARQSQGWSQTTAVTPELVVQVVPSPPPAQVMVQLPLGQLSAMQPWEALQETRHCPLQSTRHSPELRQVTLALGPTTAVQSLELRQSTRQSEPQLCVHDRELSQVSRQPFAHCV